MYQKIYKTGYFVYLALFILSVVFYKERIILLDDAYYLFNIVKDGTFFIQHFRYIAVVTQVFPLLAIKLSLPLNGVLMLYSAAFIVYYFACYLICGWLKEYRLGIVLLLVNILFSTHTFYWMLSELTLGLVMMIVLLAFVNSRTSDSGKMLTVLILTSLIPTIAFAHPLLIVPLSFGLAFLVLDKDSSITFKAAAGLMTAYIAVLIFKALFFKEAYETQSMHGLRNFKTLFPDYFSIHSNIQFLTNCLVKYQWVPVFFIATVAVFLKWGKTLKLWLYLAYVIGFMGLINVSYPTSKTYEFYMENLYMPLGFLLALPLVYNVLPVLEKKQYATSLTILFFSACLIRIYAGHMFYSERLDWQRDFLAEHKKEKLVINARHVPMDTLLMSWGSPYELWLLSTVEQKKTASIVVADSLNPVYGDYGEPARFVTTWGVFAYKQLNARYFKFTDSVTKYRVVE